MFNKFKNILECQEYQKYTKDAVCIPTAPLISGGDNAKDHEFPHFALLGYGHGDNSWNFKCGGSLISENYILTSASCLNFR